MYLKNKNFLLIILNQIFNLFSVILFNVVAVTFIYSKTNSIKESSYIIILATISTIIGGFFSQYFLDKISNKKILILGNLLCFITMIIFSFTILKNINIYYFYFFTFILNIINSIYKPARLAIIPHIIEKDKLLRANSILVTISQIFQSTSWLFVIPLVEFLKIRYTIYLIAISYLISTICILYIKENIIYEKKEKIHSSTHINIYEIFKLLVKNKIIRAITIMDIIENFGNVVWLQPFLLAFTLKILKVDSKWWGYQGSSYFIGVIFGSIILAKYSNIFRKNIGKTLILTSFFVFLTAFIYSLNTIAILAVIYSFFVGIPSQVRNIIQETLIQEYSDKDVLARIFSVRNIILQISYILSIFIGSYISDKIGIKSTFILASIIYLSIAIYAILSQTLKNFK